jgi:hypothetical protein
VALQPNRTLKIYGIPKDSLKEYKSMAKKGNFSFDNEPSAKYRLKDQEVEAQQETEEEKNDDMEFNTDPSNFEFVHRSTVNMKPAQQKANLRESEDINLLDDGMLGEIDNLNDHFQEMQISAQSAERRVTKEERDEFRSTTLVKRRITLDKS